MGGCQSRAKNRAKLLARLEQQELQRGPCRQLPHPVWGAFRFQRLDLLGRGAGGITYLCRCLDTDETVAIKMIKRPIPYMMGHLMLREIMIQAELGAGHINIVGVKEVILTDTHLGIVMECANGGNLARYLMKKMQQQGPVTSLLLDEAEASYLFRQLVSAVEYCHDNCIAHRDIKLDNTLLDHNHPPTLKLCDFGLSRCWGQEGPEMHSLAGTPTYMSPEVLRQTRESRHGGYDATKSDVWSLAVVLFVMLVGRFPFDGEGMKAGSHKESLQLVYAQQQAIKSWRELPFAALHCPFMSDALLDLLDRMFDMDATKRISVSDILQHPWCTRSLPPRMQTAWDRMQRLQLAKRLHFFPTQPRCGSFASRNRQSDPTPVLPLSCSDCSTSVLTAPDKIQAKCCHTSLPPCTYNSPRLPTAHASSTEDSPKHQSSHCADPIPVKLERSAHHSARGSMDQGWLATRACKEEEEQAAAVCEARAHSSLAHAKAITPVGFRQKARSNSTIPPFSSRCQCYAAHDTTPEQCAEELQQVLTMASMQTGVADPDALLARAQLLKVLYHVPLHKIPTISYFKDVCASRRPAGASQAALPITKPVPAQVQAHLSTHSSHIAASSQPGAVVGQSPGSAKTPVLSGQQPNRSWNNSTSDSLHTSGSSINLPAKLQLPVRAHSTTSSLTNSTPASCDAAPSHTKMDSADVHGHMGPQPHVVGKIHRKHHHVPEEDDTHITPDQLASKGTSSSLTGLEPNNVSVTEQALPLSCPISALTSVLSEQQPLLPRSEMTFPAGDSDAVCEGVVKGADTFLGHAEVCEAMITLGMRSCAASDVHCCHTSMDVSPPHAVLGCTASC